MTQSLQLATKPNNLTVVNFNKICYRSNIVYLQINNEIELNFKDKCQSSFNLKIYALKKQKNNSSFVIKLPKPTVLKGPSPLNAKNL